MYFIFILFFITMTFGFALRMERNLFKISLVRNQRRLMSSTYPDMDLRKYTAEQSDFIKNIAKANVPSRLSTLLKLLYLRGDNLVSPTDRIGLNPFLIPLSRFVNGSMLCYIRWPTQKDDMDLQLIRTNPVGVQLESLGTDQYCRRIVAELDFNSNPNYPAAFEELQSHGLQYDRKDYDVMLRSGKFPAFTLEDRRLILDRYLLTKIGAFPDCYERMAENFLSQGSEVSALITCERAISVFYGWGHPLSFHALMLSRLDGRDREAKDVARTAMSSPKWTIAHNEQQLKEITKLAGFTDISIVGEMHAFRSKDPRQKDIEEGVSPVQIVLDQSAHLMDAVALGSVEGGWNGIKMELANKYEQGGYPHIKTFILS